MTPDELKALPKSAFEPRSCGYTCMECDTEYCAPGYDYKPEPGYAICPACWAKHPSEEEAKPDRAAALHYAATAFSARFA